jgi:O-antigen/teichoic acid export membrane protein
VKSLLAYGAGTFFPRMYAFLAVFLFSRILSVHDFGLYVLAIAVGEFCDLTASGWFRVGFLRLYHGGTIASDADRLDLTQVYLVTLRCIAVAIAMVWVSAVILVQGAWLTFGLATSLYVIANGTVQATLGTLRGEGKAIAYATLESLRPLSNLTLGLLATKLIHPTFAVAAFSVFGSNATIGVIALTAVWLQRRHLPSRDRVGEIVSYAWPLVLSGCLAATMNAADRYQLQWLLGPHAVALYAAAYAIGRQPLDILFFSFNLGSFTELMKVYDMKGPTAASQLLGRQITLLLGIALPAAVGLSLLGSDILHALFDKRYWQDTAGLIPVIALLALFGGLRSYGYDQAYYMLRKMKTQVLVMLPAVFVGVVVSAILIRYFGLSGAAYGGAVGYGSSLAVSIVLVRRWLPGRLPWYEIGKIVVALLLMAIVVELTSRYGAHDKLALAESIIAGIVTYGSVVLALDVLGMRQRLQLDLAKRWS